MILLPLHPGSQTHKNPQKHKIIHEMRPVGHKEDVLVEYPVREISVAVVEGCKFIFVFFVL